jgi:hypothetical protein
MTFFLFVLAGLCAVYATIQFARSDVVKGATPHAGLESGIDTEQDIVTAWGDKKRMTQVADAANQRLRTAQAFTAIKQDEESYINAAKLGGARLQRDTIQIWAERMEAENRGLVANAASHSGVPYQDYSRIVVKLLETQMELDKHQMTLEANLEYEKLQAKAAIEIAIVKADEEFRYRRHLLDEVVKLRMQIDGLQNGGALPLGVRNATLEDLRRELTIVEEKYAQRIKQGAVSEPDWRRA